MRARDYILERVRSQKEQRAIEKLAVALLAEKAGIEVEEAQILVDEPAVRQLVQR